MGGSGSEPASSDEEEVDGPVRDEHDPDGADEWDTSYAADGPRSKRGADAAASLIAQIRARGSAELNAELDADGQPDSDADVPDDIDADRPDSGPLDGDTGTANGTPSDEGCSCSAPSTTGSTFSFRALVRFLAP